jgi:hypothetical protein
MSQLSRICLCCISDGIPRRSFVVALIVGTILNLINQGDTLVAGERVNVAKILLTYAVPYCVATYGAVSFRLATMRAGAIADARGQKRDAD